MLYNFTKPIIGAAEHAAGSGVDLNGVLTQLRKLSLENFGELLISMPNDDYPALSKLLPRMAPEQVQLGATGKTGLDLFMQTAAFARQMESITIRHAGRPLQGSRILDFGVGYGRNLRSMLYFSNPENIWGVDAWASSLQVSIDCGVPGHLARSDAKPTTLPVGSETFDLVFALSIFTHLSKEAMLACFGAIRKCTAPTGVFAFTIRSEEVWSLDNALYDHAQRMQLLEEHRRSGFAFVPLEWSKDGSYGDTSMEFEALDLPGWKFIGYDSSLVDPYQITAILKPV